MGGGGPTAVEGPLSWPWESSTSRFGFSLKGRCELNLRFRTSEWEGIPGVPRPFISLKGQKEHWRGGGTYLQQFVAGLGLEQGLLISALTLWDCVVSSHQTAARRHAAARLEGARQ